MADIANGFDKNLRRVRVLTLVLPKAVSRVRRSTDPLKLIADH